MESLILWSQKTAETSGIEYSFQAKAQLDSAVQILWRLLVKVGDIVKYGYSIYDDGAPVIGKVLSINHEGGTLKVLDKHGEIDWFVTSYCEVINGS